MISEQYRDGLAIRVNELEQHLRLAKFAAEADEVEINSLREQLAEREKQIVMLRSVVGHVLRCIPINGFAQIHYGSATAADLDEALAATEEN